MTSLTSSDEETKQKVQGLFKVRMGWKMTRCKFYRFTSAMARLFLSVRICLIQDLKNWTIFV